MSAAAGPPDVAVIGGGMIGCAAAAFLAGAGARVELFERHELAGAASGRNSGSVQHPFDPVLAELHFETLRHLSELDGFRLPPAPAGVLMLAGDREAVAAPARQIAREQPELHPELLDPDAVRQLEPALAEGLWACRLETGYPVAPAAATLAFAARARRAGAALHEWRGARPWVEDGALRGVLVDGAQRPAGAVVVCAGPWTPAVVEPTLGWRPISAVWGVVVSVDMADPPGHVAEQVGVEEVAAGAESGAPDSIFSVVAADGKVSVGSTFLAEEPDPVAWIAPIRRRAARFLPGVGRAGVEGARACARPVSLDGRPLVGEPGMERLWVAAGHGPWGISTGAATGRLVADALLGRAEVPAELSASRFALD